MRVLVFVNGINHSANGASYDHTENYRLLQETFANVDYIYLHHNQTLTSELLQKLAKVPGKAVEDYRGWINEEFEEKGSFLKLVGKLAAGAAMISTVAFVTVGIVKSAKERLTLEAKKVANALYKDLNHASQALNNIELIVVGHSHGGMVVGELMKQLQQNPLNSQVRNLITFGSPSLVPDAHNFRHSKDSIAGIFDADKIDDYHKFAGEEVMPEAHTLETHLKYFRKSTTPLSHG
eukprot:m.75977 g.75977  ORF g.75977 m.75977 type:complete len:236 (-) comp12535_c0_seq1:115-822(-)